MFPYKYVNPSFPLGNGQEEEDRGCFFSYETVSSPLGDEEVVKNQKPKRSSRRKTSKK